MPQEIHLWKVGKDDYLTECIQSLLNLESRLEDWLNGDISILAADLLVIGRQVKTKFGGFIDLLCIDRIGDLVIVELKRDKTPREITAQALDYASWVNDLTRDAISDVAREFGSIVSLEEAFQQHFGEELPEALNENHRILIVASKIDPSSERIIKYLSNTYGVNINAVTFHYFKSDDGGEFLARAFLIDPVEVESQSERKGSSKRRPNLSYEELEQLAAQNDVGDLYRKLVAGLEQHLQTHTTRSSLAFSCIFDDSRKTVISLIPGQCSKTEGVRFQIYIGRFEKRFRLSTEEALGLLPPQRKEWKFPLIPGPDWSGFEGFFATQAEVDRLLERVARSKPIV